jgi:hypothetical protein
MQMEMEINPNLCKSASNVSLYNSDSPCLVLCVNKDSISFLPGTTCSA